jgi:proton glutamate symport protein
LLPTPVATEHPREGRMTDSGRRFRFTLTHQILLGLVLGCLIGLVWPETGIAIKPISDLFLRLIRMVLAPLLITTLVASLAGAGAKVVGRVGAKAIIWFELATTVALILGLAVANLVQPGAGAPHQAAAAVELAKPKTFFDFVLNAVPESFVDAMAHNNVLQIVVFSVFFGLAVSAAGARAKQVKDLADAGAEAVFKLVGFVMRFAPFGVCAAIAAALGKSGPAVLLPLLKCVGALYGALIVFFLLLFAALKFLTRANLRTFLAAIREPAVIAFTTSTSDAALPRAMEVLEQLGVPRRIVSFVVPLGYVFNLDGSTLYLSLAVVFVSQAAHVDMSLGDQLGAMLVLMLASKGVAGVPRAALVVLSTTVTGFHLPQEGVALLIGIDAVMDMARTCVNVVGNCVAAVVVGAWEKAIPEDAQVFRPLQGPFPAAGTLLPEARLVRDGKREGDPDEPPAQQTEPQ